MQSGSNLTLFLCRLIRDCHLGFGRASVKAFTCIAVEVWVEQAARGADGVAEARNEGFEVGEGRG